MNSNTGFDKLTPLFDNKQKPIFKKYLPISEIDYKWGFFISDVGYAEILANSNYPPKGHPGTHTFSWETGRILNEFHFVLITKGQGIFESRSAGRKNIKAGEGFFLFPGEWHRYKPLQNTGWTENWVGFSGQIPDIIMKEYFFSKEQPIIQECTNMLVLNLFKTLFQFIYEEPYGFQRMASGVCLQLLAEIYNIKKGSVKSIQANSLISKAKYLMQKKIDEDIDLHDFCKDYGISYSKFRTDFKRQIGFAPFQYFLLMKIEKAKDLLNNTDLSAKQIAYNLGFKTDHYFCRIFKLKTGSTPQQFRKMAWVQHS